MTKAATPNPETMPEQSFSGASELLAMGHQLMRVENDSMLAIAIKHPRDESRVLQDALKELDLVPEEAAKSFYDIPYRDTSEEGQGQRTMVSGPSIKAAMTLTRRWGNCTVGARCLSEDEDGWDIEGVFIDLESNFRVARPFRVSKWFRRRSGDVIRLPVNRQLMAFQAGASKAIRNACLAGLPPYLVQGYYNKARAIAGGKLDEKATREAIAGAIIAFSKVMMGETAVTTGHLEQYLKKPVAEWLGEDVAGLRGLFNAIADGQVSPAEAFGVAAAPPATDDPQPSTVMPQAATTQAEAPPPTRAPDEPKAAPGKKPTGNGDSRGVTVREKVWSLLVKHHGGVMGANKKLRELTGKVSLANLDDTEAQELLTKLQG